MFSLKDLKVIELSGVLAGPSVGMFLAELDADVIKIENKKTNGDITRSWKQKGEDKSSSVSAYFSSINYKKNYQFVDFHNPQDIQNIHELIQSADILIANFKKGDAEKYKLDYTSLKKKNPKLIYGLITGFGTESDRVAYDLVLQAESGFMSMNGFQNSDPVKMPVALIDVLAGHQLKEGILLALLRREKEDVGSLVHVSLYNAALASLVNQASNYLMTGNIPSRMGSKHPNIAPYGELFKTSDDKYVTFAIGSNEHFRKLCTELNLEKLIDDLKFETNQLRVENRELLEQLIREKVSSINSKNLEDKMHKQLIPFAIVKNLEEVFSDEKAQKMIRVETIDGIETKRASGNAFEFLD